MPAAKRKKRASKMPAAAKPRPIRREVGSVVFIFLSVFAFLGLFNVKALLINLICGLAWGLMGWGFYLLPFSLLGCGIVLLFHRGRPVALRLWCTMLAPFLLGAILHLFLPVKVYPWSWNLFRQFYTDGLSHTGGGVFGGILSMALTGAVSRIGAAIVFIVGFIALTLGALNLSIPKIVDLLRRERPIYEPEPPRPVPAAPVAASAKFRKQIDIPLDDAVSAPPEPVKGLFKGKNPAVRTPADVMIPPDALGTTQAAPEPIPAAPPVPAAAVPVTPPSPKSEKAKPEPAPENNAVSGPGYAFPPITLLTAGGPSNVVDGSEELKTNAHRLMETIHSFGIEARIINVTRGPTVTRYELEMDKGVKLSRLTGLSDDIALSLGASGVRIAPIPDKIAVVGIEVPNKLVSIVYIRDVIASREFLSSPSKVSFAIGKDISGQCIVGDIARLPHLLIAGTTGSGKSVCMNSLIISLLYKSSPEDVRLIMIDPKMIELGIYNGIPHLLIPVVTDPKKASGALQWAVTEMMKRYKLFSERSVRDIFAYNASVLKDPDCGLSKLAQIVIVIDELADLMLVAAKEVEESVCRIAQMARAAGMHLVIATQRPSADVITGIMKANIPSRIAFAVASQLESRIILDTMGAEKLVGRGDMLYFPLGIAKPARIQGTLISGSEVEAVVDYIKRSSEPEYSEEIIQHIERQAEAAPGSSSSGTSIPENDEDDLLPAAIEVVVETGQASVSMLQRRLKLGYSRAARLVDQMEERGIVGPFEGSKPRQLLITRQQWQEMQLRRNDMDE